MIEICAHKNNTLYLYGIEKVIATTSERPYELIVD